ncbi:hypothetical protein TRFO_10670 [Tritrichomonas foetus]|uniref:DUF3730 domain-containing protein n=1 Tax=Tritrichomonas foetus TaxID=1144522 RepID=A0A1J4J7I6_9EUKA|nr:hypothetical protein TRFO_10670 [Tritrichomonas foetus]|eukprot:OHS95178.1 hypothetical protein TRFO_10670 [Tritrichomonas foetus]
MEALLSDLQRLSNSKRVIQPEQVILQSLVKFDMLFPQLSNDNDFQQLEKAIFNLLKINNGELSVQCSISIAFRLTKLYGKMSEPPIASAISDLVNKLTPASVVAIGEICNRTGSRCASQMPKAIDSIILLPEDKKFHSLFALRGIFRSKVQMLSKYCQPVYKLLRKSIDVTPESNQIMALKLMKAILSFDQSYFSNAIECVDACILKQQTPFVKYQASRLAAQCALLQHQKSGLKESFNIIKKYTNYLSPIINRFLEILPGNVISQNINELFMLIRQTSPSDIKAIESFLTQTEKQNLFGAVLSEQKPSSSQLHVLNTLLLNDSDIVACAGAAMHLARSNDSKDTESAAFFFSNLTKTHPDLAQHFLQSSLNELTRNKTDFITAGNQVVALAILEVNPNLIHSLKQLVDEYISTITSLTDYLSVRYAALWSILSYAPSEFLSPENLSGVLQKTCDLLSSTTSFDSKWEQTIEGLLRFYAHHSNFTKTDLLFSCAQTNINKLTDVSVAYFAKFIIHSQRNCDSLINFFITKAISLYPGRTFLKSQIDRVVVTGDDLLLPKTEEIPTLRHLATQSIIKQFPDLLKCCQSSSKETVVNSIVSQATTPQQMLVAHSILLNIVYDDSLANQLPKSFIGLILKTLKGSDYLRIQITCEVVSKMIERQPSMIDALFRFVEMNKRAVSCLILSSLMCRLHISNSLLTRALLFIDERLLNHYSAPFALHALSTALITHTDNILELGIAGQHINLILKQLHDTTSLHPVIIHLLSQVFVDILPVVSQQLSNNANFDILSIVESIRATPYSFAEGVYYLTISSLAQVSYQIAATIPIEFPTSEKTPFSILLAASEAYSMIGRGTVTEQIPKLLIAIDRTTSPMAVSAVGQLLARESGEMLLTLIRSVLIDRSLPSSGISPSSKVKLAILQSLGTIFETITINEASTIAMALCNSAASGVLALQAQAFPMLSALLQRFTFANLQEHFARLVPIAFKLNFSISGGFLVSFMSKENLPLCFASLASCTNDSPEYFAMFTRALKLSRENTEVSDAVRKFAPIIQPKLSNIVNIILKSPSQASNYQQIFSDLWQSLVYVDYVIGKPSIKPEVLLSYFVVELNSCSDAWKANGYIHGAAAILQYYANQLVNGENNNLIKEIIESAIFNLPMMKGQIEESIAELYKFVSQISNLEQESWDTLLYSLIHADFEIETAARCFDHFNAYKLEQVLPDLAKVIFGKAQQDEEKVLALFKILLSKVKKGISSLINEAIEWSKSTPNTTSFTFRLISLFIRFFIKVSKENPENEDCILDYDLIADFALNHFRNGGFNFIASVMCHNAEIGTQLALRGAAKAAASLVSDDQANADQYIKFLLLCEKKMNQEDFQKVMVQIAMKASTNTNIDQSTILSCVHIFKTAQSDNHDSFKEFWESQSESDRELCVRNILSVST